MPLVLLLGSGEAEDVGGSSIYSLFDSSTGTKTLSLVISDGSVFSKLGILELNWLPVMLPGVDLEILMSWLQFCSKDSGSRKEILVPIKLLAVVCEVNKSVNISSSSLLSLSEVMVEKDEDVSY